MSEGLGGYRDSGLRLSGSGNEDFRSRARGFGFGGFKFLVWVSFRVWESPTQSFSRSGGFEV